MAKKSKQTNSLKRRKTWTTRRLVLVLYLIIKEDSASFHRAVEKLLYFSYPSLTVPFLFRTAALTFRQFECLIERNPSNNSMQGWKIAVKESSSKRKSDKLCNDLFSLQFPRCEALWFRARKRCECEVCEGLETSNIRLARTPRSLAQISKASLLMS